ncbi:uncharacterized protein LOC111277573 [Durio zibethinus]|uniref:Uncharacterized protein LOC111277573 n=1 Tax=Durio zibethinus TaxID=66656 RepID=A0A6P5WW49_DURZI|nr:uncharacterized protein LOC111277573 [Durio zibethinus]
MASALTLALPRYIVLKSNDKIDYLGYSHDDGESNGYIRFMETQAVSPYARFEVETASTNGMVHIRSCQNNKYWVRTKNLSITGNPAEQYWITATTVKPEEDQSKESCTLFKPISVDPATNTVRIMHVQSGCYLCLWRFNNQNFARCVLANYKVYDHNSLDIFTIIDWQSLVILPRYVAFKGDNGKYLCLRQIQGYPYLQFSTTDIGDSSVPCEVFNTNDGDVRIKTISSNKFWRRSPNWIWADSNDISSNKDALFLPVIVNDTTIGLLNLGNNNFCKRLTTEGKTNCLNAAVPSVTKEAQLTVEEPVLTRDIYNVKYDLDNSRVYDERVLLVAKNSADNYTQQSSTLDVKLSYTDTKTSTWKTMFSLQLGMKTSFDIGLPLIFEGKVELSGEVQSATEWGETTTSTSIVEVVHKVTVPPMTKVTVHLIATNGKCDVPFTFMQRDTLYNGATVTTEVQGGTSLVQITTTSTLKPKKRRSRTEKILKTPLGHNLGITRIVRALSAVS